MVTDQITEPDFETLKSVISAAQGLNKVLVGSVEILSK